MTKQAIEHLLAEYVDRAKECTTEAHDQNPLRLTGDQGEELLSLLEVADQVKKTLRPTELPNMIKRQLRGQLLETAQRKRSNPVVLEKAEVPRRLVVSAAVGSVVALAGGLVYLIRTKIQSRS